MAVRYDDDRKVCPNPDTCPSCTYPLVDEALEDDLEDDIDVGSCAWGSGAYGIVGQVHIAIVDGQREECCTFA